MSGSALTQRGERAWSYQTAIKDVLPDGRSIGNVTKYSTTTSNHQNKARVRACDVVVDNVPLGTPDLAVWYWFRPQRGGDMETERLPALADVLEELIDRTTMGEVLAALVRVCAAKGEHLRDNWQDAGAARAWETLGEKLEGLTGAAP